MRSDNCALILAANSQKANWVTSIQPDKYNESDIVDNDAATPRTPPTPCPQTYFELGKPSDCNHTQVNGGHCYRHPHSVEHFHRNPTPKLKQHRVAAVSVVIVVCVAPRVDPQKFSVAQRHGVDDEDDPLHNSKDALACARACVCVCARVRVRERGRERER